MSVQLALLKSGEEVIADIKEFRNSDDELVSYLFKDPFSIKIKTSQVLIEGDGAPKHDVVYYKWMSLSKDNDIIVNKDWVVCITDPLDSITKSYTERMNGRGINNQSTDRRDGGDTSNPSTVLNEQLDLNQSD